MIGVLDQVNETLARVHQEPISSTRWPPVVPLAHFKRVHRVIEFAPRAE